MHGSELGIVSHACNTSTQEAEAEDDEFETQRDLVSKKPRTNQPTKKVSQSTLKKGYCPSEQGERSWKCSCCCEVSVFHIHFLLSSLCAYLHSRDPPERGICPQCHFPTSLTRSLGRVARVRCQGNSCF
jgi:hypothetical protein